MGRTEQRGSGATERIRHVSAQQKAREKIQIGTNITMTVVHISRSSAVGIRPPPDVPIHRMSATQTEAEQAQSSAPRSDSPLLADCA